MAAPENNPAYCSDLSQQAGELLYGTAPQAQAYLLLEYAGAWGEKALEESNIPEPVKAYVNDLGRQVSGLKTLLIRTQRQQRLESGLRLFVAVLSVSPPRLYAFSLSNYDQLLDLELLAVLAGYPTYAAHLRNEPLYLVCAHGRRDRCCSRLGLPVYNALSAATRSSPEPLVWQSSHVGGHRFAANLLCLPHGLMYGRVSAETALAILDADRHGRIYLPNLRGRVSDPAVAQAAEYFLRQQNSEDHLNAYRLVDVQEFTEDERLVRFRLHPAQDMLAIKVTIQVSEERIFESCSLDKTTPSMRYQFQRVGS